MIRISTVIVLGAGGSMPYGFWSGQGLLEDARRFSVDQFEKFIPPEFRGHAVALHAALSGTLSTSIDAMLETRPSLVDAGKALMARWLLYCERNWRDNQRQIEARQPRQKWHELLWSACDLRSLEAFRATPLTLITYNYDRSIEFALARALKETFEASAADCAMALDCIGPIHLHGQLGILPDFSGPAESVIPFGAGNADISDGDIITAAQGIKIVHEPKPTDEAFVRARVAIGAAARVIFLGFGYSRQNVKRLLLKDCLNRAAKLYLCVTGFSPKEVTNNIRPQFGEWGPYLEVGEESDDIVQFFRRYPEALL